MKKFDMNDPSTIVKERMKEFQSHGLTYQEMMGKYLYAFLDLATNANTPYEAPRLLGQLYMYLCIKERMRSYKW